MSPIVLTPEIVNDTWFTDKPQRLLWWSKLVMSASEKDKNIVVLKGKAYKAKRGELLTTYGELAKMCGATRREMQLFVAGLTQKQLIGYTSGTNLIHLTVCNYDSYDTLRYSCGTDLVQQEKRGTKLVQTNGVISDSYDTSRYSCGTISENSKDEKDEKDEKRKNQRKKKNKEESYALTSVRISDADTLSPRTREESEKTEKKQNIITRCRAIFESYFKEIYHDSYYWSAKDAVATKGILQKIKFRRTDRPVPLPVDDDSMVDAFGKFIRSINKSWIINNFSLPKINSQYNDIISEIRNSRTTQQAGANILNHQMAAVINDLQKADELYGPSQQGGT